MRGDRISRNHGEHRLTGMPSDKSYDPAPLETLLRRAFPATDEAWVAAHARFAARAASEGLIDVAFEDHETPLGRMRLSATEHGIVRLILPTEDADEVLEHLARKVSSRILRTSTPTITGARRQLDEYFERSRRIFDVPLDWTLTTGFRREVLRATAQIPYGQTASYRQVAIVAGSPNAVRAAGSALANNPLPILVPCHRVLRTDGGLGQYLGGQAAKTQLLTLEKAVSR
jgi:methylated-DNA-[protein]-cysteine S-methyltransferase